MKGDTASSARMGGEEVLSQAEMEITEHRVQPDKCQGISTTVTNHLRAVTAAFPESRDGALP